jgi:hypothetical protein
MENGQPWDSLQPGDLIRITSLSGNIYEACVLLCGKGEAGLYVRRNGRIGRLLYNRLDWSTLERTGQTDPIVKGDNVLVAPVGGSERRGKILGPLDERLDLGLVSGGVYSAPLGRLANESFRLIFNAQDLRPGDEFTVSSTSGREIRGRCLELLPGVAIAELHPDGKRVRVSLERLDMTTLAVLVPIPLEALGCSPTV